MNQEDYQVMISGRQYKQFVGYKKEVKILKTNLIKSQQQHISKDEIIRIFEKQIISKNKQILYLEDLIGKINRNKLADNQSDMLELDQTFYQILGQSVQFSKQDLQQENIKEKQNFANKFEKQILIVQQNMEKLDSQQSQIKSFIEEIKNLKNNNSKLAILIGYYNNKLKELSVQNIKKKLSSQINKKILLTTDQAKTYQIRSLINQYIAEMDTNFKQIKGISEKERDQLIKSELKYLKFNISKSLENSGK